MAHLARPGAEIVEGFGVEEYGAPMFFPDSREWRSAHGKPAP